MFTMGRPIKQRPSVQAMQTGGYRRSEVPDPNDPVANYGNFASNNPTHVAGGMSGQEFNSLMANKGQERSEAFRQDAKDQGGMANVTQGIKTVPTSKRWDAFFGALQNAGADNLTTLGAGATMGDYQEDSPGMFSRGIKPGFFDHQSMDALQQQRTNYMNASDANRRRY